MRLARFLPLLAVLLLAACESDDDLPPEGPPVGPPPDAAGRPDLSSPEAAVKAFCAAVVASDERVAGACLVENPGEKELVLLKMGEMTIEEGFRDGGRGMVVAEVLSSEPNRLGTESEVTVRFASGSTETFTVVKTPGGWKVSDF